MHPQEALHPRELTNKNASLTRKFWDLILFDIAVWVCPGIGGCASSVSSGFMLLSSFLSSLIAVSNSPSNWGCSNVFGLLSDSYGSLRIRPSAVILQCIWLIPGENTCPMIPVDAIKIISPRAHSKHLNKLTDKQKMGRLVTKHTKWHVRPAKAQISLGIRPVWSEYSLALNGYLRNQAFFMRTVKTLIRLGGCPGWSESSLGAHATLLVLSEGAQITF